MTTLERRYRRLLRWYPKSYRDSRGDEIVSTLLDLAPPGRRRPSPAEAADLIEGGLRCRLGAAGADGLDDGLAHAAPVALALLGGAGTFLWWRVEPLGPPTLGPVAYAAWLLACAVALVGPGRWIRPALASALAVTLALPAVAPLTAYARPPLWVLMTLTVFGLIALTGTGATRRDLESRATPALGAVAVACGADLVSRAWPDPLIGYYQPAFAQLGLVVAAAVGTLAILALSAVRRGAPTRPWLWATLLIGLPGAWLGPLDADTWRTAADLPRFGRLAQVLLGTTLVLLTMARLRATPRRSCAGGGYDTHSSGESATVRAKSSRSWAAAGLAGYGVGLAGFVGVIGAVTVHAVSTVAVCVVAAVLLGSGQRSWSAGMLRVGGVVAVGTPAAAYAVGVYSNDWTLGGWSELTRTAGLAAMLAVLPLAFAAYTAYRSARQVSVVAAGLLCVGWLAWLTVPDLPAWGPVLPVLVAVPLVRAALAIAPWRPRTGP